VNPPGYNLPGSIECNDGRTFKRRTSKRRGFSASEAELAWLREVLRVMPISQRLRSFANCPEREQWLQKVVERKGKET
jgi:hypothetical protein